MEEFEKRSKEIEFKFEQGRLSGMMEIYTLAADVLSETTAEVELYRKLQQAGMARFNEQQERLAKLREELGL